jgi:hypothetical protein
MEDMPRFLQEAMSLGFLLNWVASVPLVAYIGNGDGWRSYGGGASSKLECDEMNFMDRWFVNIHTVMMNMSLREMANIVQMVKVVQKRRGEAWQGMSAPLIYIAR